MAFSPKNALEAARNLVYGPRIIEAARLNLIATALSPRQNYVSPDGTTYLGGYNQGQVSVEMPKGASDSMQHLAQKSRTNFLPLVVDTFSQVMKVDGYKSASGPGNLEPWDYAWQANSLDARQTGIHRSALAYGAAYATVLPGDTDPVIKGVSPRQMTALYEDPVDDDWPMMAVRVDGQVIRLYDEDMVYFIGIEKQPRSGLGASMIINPGVQWVFIEARPHGTPGRCPIVRFRDRMLLEGDEQYGIVEPLLDIQRRIDETTFGMLVAQYYAAFKQRYVIGWVPQTEQEELRANAAEFWSFKDPKTQVEVGQFAETDLTRYIESKNSALQDMAAIAQVPAQGLGVSGIHNVSAEALALLEGNKERKGSEIMTSFGESWEQTLRLAASIKGDDSSASDMSAQVRWKDASTQSLAQTVDALGKMTQMIGVPPEMVWSMIPGWTDQDVEQAKAMAQKSDTMSALMDTLQRQAAPVVAGSRPVAPTAPVTPATAAIKP